MLSYNYWMREEKMRGAGCARLRARRHRDRLRLHGAVRHLDHADRQRGVLPAGRRRSRDAQAVPKMAEMLGTMLGPFGVYAFSVGFWAAVFASLLGVWQSVPYLYADFYGIVKKLPPDERARGDQGDEHAVSAGAGLHHARAAAVRVHRPAAVDHRHLHDRRQPVRAVPRGDAALPEQPRPVDRRRCRAITGRPTRCSSRSWCCSPSSARRKCSTRCEPEVTLRLHAPMNASASGRSS